MRDSGLDEAIRVAGGVGGLARKIGTSQRADSLKATTGRDRAILRADLHGERADMTDDVDDIDAARAREYALLSLLLLRAPDSDLLRRLAQLRGDASPLGAAHAALAEAASATTAERVEREYFNLFIGVGRGEVLPYASYYLTGFLQERPLARLRQDLARLGIERAPGHSEPEDHAGILCEIMAGLAGGRLPAPPAADRVLFEAHIAPWMARFFADLERAQAAEFYGRIGALGRVFMEIESEAFALPG
jgi:TorA maturation chaperone TorD